MTLNSSGPISLAGTTAGQSIEIENGGNGTTQISLNDTAVRALAGVTTPNSTIIMPTNFYGKSNRVSISYTFTSSTTNASLNVGAIGGYSSGKSDITVTVNSGVYLWANSTGNYGLNLTGATTGDTLTLVNNGYIMGQGGNGANGGASGSAGGPALNIGTGISLTITNTTGYIGGGGGGGGSYAGGGGGGAGGGGGGTSSGSGAGGGSGGSIGGGGSNGGRGSNACGYCVLAAGGGGGGGRVFPGSGGGGGGAGGGCLSYGDGGCGGTAGGGGGGVWNYGQVFNGGPGGSGSSGGSSSAGAGGGGGWGASGGGSSNGGGGGGGGKAVNLNGKTVTWTSGYTAHVYGAVS